MEKLKDILNSFIQSAATSAVSLVETIRAGVATSDLSSCFQATITTIVLELPPGSSREYEILFDIIFKCTEADICRKDQLLLTIEEIIDIQTIDECAQLFTYLELHRTEIARNMGSGSVLLRLCNELLRRLSKAGDTVFCGRILIFLSLSFPLKEKSALNIKGEFNTDNVTLMNSLDGPEDQFEDEPTSLTILYPIFWSLQRYFNNPSILHNPAEMETFKTSLGITLETLKTLEESRSKTDSSKPDPRRNADPDMNLGGYFSPKLLTSKKLLKLEVQSQI